MALIKQITAREILNAKGNPTVEATVVLDNGSLGIAACPSGTSIGKYEAVDLKDNDPKRYSGLGVLKAVENIEKIIAPKLISLDVSNQQSIDRTMIELDSTPNKERLGANAILAVSMAVCKAAANSQHLPLFLYLRRFIKGEKLALKIPTPIFNLINGGLHGGGNLNFQEFIVVPATSKSYLESLSMGISIYKTLKEILKQKNLSTLIGDEGGYAPQFSTNTAAFLALKEATEAVGFRLGLDVFLGVDAASDTFYQDGKYQLKDKTVSFAIDDLIIYYQDLYSKYKLLYLEDIFAENDWDGWTAVYAKMSGSALIVGDDLIATNPTRLQMAINKKAINAVIIKPNQIGTVTETLAVSEIARTSGLKVVVSHRSGETNDDFIADFAVAVGADYCKFGAPARGERVAKYNRLLDIDQQIRTAAA